MESDDRSRSNSYDNLETESRYLISIQDWIGIIQLQSFRLSKSDVLSTRAHLHQDVLNTDLAGVKSLRHLAAQLSEMKVLIRECSGLFVVRADSGHFVLTEHTLSHNPR